MRLTGAGASGGQAGYTVIAMQRLNDLLHPDTLRGYAALAAYAALLALLAWLGYDAVRLF